MTTPTTQQISDNLIAQLQTALSQTIPLLPKSFERVLAKALAGLFVILHKYVGWGVLQGFVAHASDQPTEINGKIVTPLHEWGELIGLGLPVGATQAEFDVLVEVNSQTGSIATGELLLGATNGVTYITTVATALNAATVTVPVRAVSDQSGGDGSGVQGNLQVGDTLSFVSPLSQINREVTVDSIITTAADQESSEDYRARVVDRFKRRAQGGAATDYAIWGLEPVGIINIYPYTGDNPGTVEVYAEATVASSGNADGIPTVAQLQAVSDSIELDTDGRATRRPLGSLVNVLPITRKSFDIQIADLIVADPVSVQAQIETAVLAHIAEREPFVVGLSIPPRKDLISRTVISGIASTVIGAANGQFTSLNILDGVVNVNQYSLIKGEKVKIGAFSYV